MDEQDFNTFSESQLSTAKGLLFSFIYSIWKTKNRKINKPWPESPVKKGQSWKGMRWGREGIHWARIVCSLEICSSRQSGPLPLRQILPASLTHVSRTYTECKESPPSLLTSLSILPQTHPSGLSRSVHSILRLPQPRAPNFSTWRLQTSSKALKTQLFSSRHLLSSLEPIFSLFFFHVCDKMSDRSNLRKGSAFWLMIKGDRVHHVRNKDHIVSAVKKWRKMRVAL